MSAAETAQKQRGRPFRPGESGNPAGRPRGARNKATILADTLREQEAVAKAEALIDRALAGNVAAIRTFLNRVAPVEHDMVHFDLSDLRTLSDIIDASASLIAAVAAGEIGVSEARRAMKLLVAHQARLAARDDGLAIDTGGNSGQGRGVTGLATDCSPAAATPNSELTGQIQRAAPSDTVRSAEPESVSASPAVSPMAAEPATGTQPAIQTADFRYRRRLRRVDALRSAATAPIAAITGEIQRQRPSGPHPPLHSVPPIAAVSAPALAF